MWTLVTAVQARHPPWPASKYPRTDDLVREAVCELANQIIGNSVHHTQRPGISTFTFRPPTLHTFRAGQQKAVKTQKPW